MKGKLAKIKGEEGKGEERGKFDPGARWIAASGVIRKMADYSERRRMGPGTSKEREMAKERGL